jgi:hypothetical protein
MPYYALMIEVKLSEPQTPVELEFKARGKNILRYYQMKTSFGGHWF